MTIASVLSDLFVPQVSLLEKALRALLVFVFLVVALRLGGKRELGQINVLDLAVLLLVSNALQNAMIGPDNSLVGGVVGATTLFAANYLFVRVVFRSRRVIVLEPNGHLAIMGREAAGAWRARHAADAGAPPARS